MSKPVEWAGFQRVSDKENIYIWHGKTECAEVIQKVHAVIGKKTDQHKRLALLHLS